MGNIEQIIDKLSDDQKEILLRAEKPGSTILFNIKGMIQVLHEEGPFDFIEMGYEDITFLKKKGLINMKRGMRESHVLQGEEYVLSPLGHEVAKQLTKS